jgi:hypothetical protein
VPGKYQARLASRVGTVSDRDYRPTDRAKQVAQELTRQIDAELAKLRKVLDEDLASFNEVLARKKVPGCSGNRTGRNWRHGRNDQFSHP